MRAAAHDTNLLTCRGLGTGTSLATRGVERNILDIQIFLGIAGGAALVVALSIWSKRPPRRIDIVPVSNQWLSEHKRSREE
jgi:hypothetical protein